MSASGYTNRRRVTTLAKATKVQYTNHQVSVDSLVSGVLPCISNLNQLVFVPNPRCGGICTPITPLIVNIDCGNPSSNYRTLDGGFPGSSGRLIDCGRI
jgi:hypothetical protein